MTHTRPGLHTLLPAALAALALAACGQKAEDAEQLAAEAEAAAEEAQALADEAAAEAEMKAKEAELARREAELSLKEREADLTRREAALAKPKSTAKPAAKPAAEEKPRVPAYVARQVTVPAGTSLTVELTSPLSTKTAKIGDRIAAQLTQDLVVDGRTVANAGAMLQGSVVDVYSGSQKIGGTPRLGLKFDNLTVANGSDVRVSGHLTQEGKRESGKDAAKIGGGALVGAVLGHQIDDDKGKVVGGLLGAAAGSYIAKRTGGEVELPAGTVIGFVLDQPVQVTL